MKQPILIIHGGAGSRFKDAAKRSQVREKIEKILSAAFEKLKISSLEAVTYAVKLLENDPAFNAGTGSLLQSDGHARLSASIMDGPQLRFAGVINLENIKNPVLVALALLKEKDRGRCGEGAFRFAKKMGLKPADTRTVQALQRWRKDKKTGMDTVGACALDSRGRLASATSTGGRGLEFPGRVSDSGMPVANYADARCAISATGIGEEIMDQGLAVRIAVRMQDGLSLQSAFEKTFREIRSRKHKMGAIGVDYKGNIMQATTTEVLIYGWQKDKQQKTF